MGGAIEVESEKNKGSTFSFSIWVGICEEDNHPVGQGDWLAQPAAGEAVWPGDSEEEEDAIKIYGTPENQENLKKVLSKLILCVEMENWEKAEMFMETVRQLTMEAPSDVKRIVLRLKMAIQKESYERITAQYAELNDILQMEG